MEKYGFFDAVVVGGIKDRTYNADDINTIFKGILGDGVFRAYDNALRVTAGGGMSVNVDTGKAIVKDHWYLNTTVKSFTLSPAHATMSRYSSVVLRYNRDSRLVSLAIIDGAPNSTPTLPLLTQNEQIYEILLYNILVGAGVTTIANNNLTDERTYVSGLVDPTPLNCRRYETVQTGYPNGQRYFDIPHSYNYTTNTHLQVFDNGLLCQTSEYAIQVNDVEGNYMVVFNTARALNTELSFVMIN